MRRAKTQGWQQVVNIVRWGGLMGAGVLLALITGVTLKRAEAATDCAATAETGIPQAECEALVALYNNTNGAHWSDSATNKWNQNQTPCGWVGITCESGHVTGISRYSKHLNGTIPATLGNLTVLQNLSLYSNQLSGAIPTALGNLTALRNLYLYSNQLDGEIPPELGNLTLLQTFHLQNNQLSGAIPVTLGRLTALQVLNLSGNKLSGMIPAEVGNLTALQALHLHNNQLSGTIPAELGNLVALQWIRLNNNQLIGEIPSAMKQLTQLDSSLTNIGYNRLFATDVTVNAFVTGKDADWAATQTVPPMVISATALSATSVRVAWTPIAYTSDGGYYQVKYATTSGGPYTNANGITTDKTAAFYDVSDLSPNATYYFVVETFTPAHIDQQNALTSSLSNEVSVTFGNTLSGTITTSNSAAVSDVVLQGLPGNPTTDATGAYAAVVPLLDWSGTVTPQKAGYIFTPSSANYANITTDQTAQNYIATLLTYTISGTITSGGMGLAGVVLQGAPGAPTTDANGAYMAEVEYGWSGTVTPVKAGYVFSPATRNYTNVTAVQTQNYTVASVSADLWTSWTMDAQKKTVSAVTMTNAAPLVYQAARGANGYAATRYSAAGGAWSAWSDLGTVPAAKPYRPKVANSVSMATFNGQVFQSIREANPLAPARNNRILTRNLTTTNNWSTEGYKAAGAVSMSVFNGKLYQTARAAAVKINGVPIPANAVLSRSFDGAAWSNWAVDASKFVANDPAMAAFNGMLYQAAIQTGAAKNVITRSSNGAAWGAWSSDTSGKKAFGAVAMAAFNGRLYQAIRQFNALTPGVGKVWTRSFDGAAWTAWEYGLTTAKSDVTMTVAVVNGQTRLYQAINGGGKVKTRYTFDGVNWSAWVAVGATGGAVAMAAVDPTPATPGNERLYQAVPRLSGATKKVWTRYTTGAAADALLSAPSAVTIRKAGIGSGTITDGSAICAAACDELRAPVIAGVTLSVTPTPDAGSTFAGWRSPVGAALTGLEYVKAGDTVIAVFEKQ